MHPNAFLQSLWREEILDQVFVAMSFDPRLTSRFESIIKPAIEDEKINGLVLQAYRVDNSKTGDSILTDIVNGIAHSRLVLADVSVVDIGRDTCNPFRNGNVMYEVGIALACRNPSEVLLIRDDDEKKFLFDVSTIPHMKVDFSDIENTIQILRAAITERLSETQLVEDVRVKRTAQTMTQDEIRILRVLAGLKPDQGCDLTSNSLGMLSAPDERGVDGLMRKGCVKALGLVTNTERVLYRLTPFGYALAKFQIKTFKPAKNS